VWGSHLSLTHGAHPTTRRVGAERCWPALQVLVRLITYDKSGGVRIEATPLHKIEHPSEVCILTGSR